MSAARDAVLSALAIVVGVLVRAVWRLNNRLTRLEAFDENRHRE